MLQDPPKRPSLSLLHSGARLAFAGRPCLFTTVSAELHNHGLSANSPIAIGQEQP